MTLPGVAIAVHLLGVLWWFGGLAFVTLVFIPALRRELQQDGPQRLLTAIERRFAPQARLALILVGLSGGYLLWALGRWHVLGSAGFWWLDAMIAYWFLFGLMLFVVEPLGLLERLFLAERRGHWGWRLFHWLHAVLLALGVIIIAAAAAGSHGY